MDVVGNELGTNLTVDPKWTTTAAWSVTRTPRVATMRTSGEARRSWRITSKWVRAPRAAEAATPATRARANGNPFCTEISHPM
jgi:hypothetical protein